jgi:hypothetical protein
MNKSKVGSLLAVEKAKPSYFDSSLSAEQRIAAMEKELSFLIHRVDEMERRTQP